MSAAVCQSVANLVTTYCARRRVSSWLIDWFADRSMMRILSSLIEVWRLNHFLGSCYEWRETDFCNKVDPTTPQMHRYISGAARFLFGVGTIKSPTLTTPSHSLYPFFLYLPISPVLSWALLLNPAWGMRKRMAKAVRQGVSDAFWGKNCTSGHICIEWFLLLRVTVTGRTVCCSVPACFSPFHVLRWAINVCVAYCVWVWVKF